MRTLCLFSLRAPLVFGSSFLSDLDSALYTAAILQELCERSAENVRAEFVRLRFLLAKIQSGRYSKKSRKKPN
jgi:hypothetical protein